MKMLSGAARLGLALMLLCGLWAAAVSLAPGHVTPALATAGLPAEEGSAGEIVRAAAEISPAVHLCQFGVGSGADIGAYAVGDLRLGWYLDWGAQSSPARPGGIAYMPQIHVMPAAGGSYTYYPQGSALVTVVAANPGALWLIGNEPDCVWQDDLEPGLYAQAYHELYYLIKSLDPSARIAAGGIVQPTPLRLQYLDLVLSSYATLYGGSLPTDAWNIHAFILREKSSTTCPPDDDCWGADIPPGIAATQGMLYTIEDNGNVDIFKDSIQRFRQWMASRGYQDRPLVISEFGIEMPFTDIFPPATVNAYMTTTFDFLTTITGTLGDPADDYRLAQRWAWYSLTDASFNGWLFDPTTHARTAFGDTFVTYTAKVTPTVNLRPVQVWSDPAGPIPQGGGVTMTLRARVINNGNSITSGTVTVRFYDGNPAAGGALIGDGSVTIPDGCLGEAVAVVIWPGASRGMHTIYVVVDPSGQVAETNEADNSLGGPVLVPSARLWLPTVLRLAQ